MAMAAAVCMYVCVCVYAHACVAPDGGSRGSSQISHDLNLRKSPRTQALVPEPLLKEHHRRPGTSDLPKRSSSSARAAQAAAATSEQGSLSPTLMMTPSEPAMSPVKAHGLAKGAAPAVEGGEESGGVEDAGGCGVGGWWLLGR